MGGLDFAHPWALLLAPLALAPLMPRRRDALTFPYLAWLPADRLGQFTGLLWRTLAALAIACTVFALAAPGRPEVRVARTGHGAEILVLVDRSRSMDTRMLPSDWRSIDPLNRLHHLDRGPQKAAVARELLSEFVQQRPNDRFALMFFSTRPFKVVPFTEHDEVIQAGVAAGGVGRGLSETEVGPALIAAAEEFNDREYSGSRIILLVSDGGAHLDKPTQRRIIASLMRNRVALYWIYLRSFNSPQLGAPAPGREMAPEIALHRFFQSLPTPYRAYEADAPEDFARAVADVGRQQNFPLDYFETLPRQDYSSYFVAVAAALCLMLLFYRALAIRRWT
ncbi:MAG TPA: vWA domain-containing protein [Steroidobacter sp.]|nr:vWA domain-containing protein [Steroidobacteraceae bacterium]HLS80554.1 vWA domain-containing protein [Steroidobacter sp.]